MTRRLVVEADGGSRGNPGPAGYGALVRDAATGEVLAEVAEGIGTATNNVAEYRGLVAGLLAARAVDPDADVEVRMDSKLVVEQMSGRWQVKHEDMRRLAREAREALPPGRVTYRWVPRASNAAADALANAAMDAAAAGRTWRPPPRTAAAAAPRATGPAPDLGAPTTLLLVRHGRTALTEERRLSGSGGSDPGLTPAGRADAEAVASALAARRDVSAVVVSPLRRTRETAEAVVRATAARLVVDDEWRELAFGEWDGATLGELVRRDPDAVARWRDDEAVAPPGGERLADLRARVGGAVRRIVERHPGEVVAVVTHAVPVRAVVGDLLGARPEAVHRLRVDPCAVTEVRLWADGGAEVVRANDGSHLAGPRGS